MGYRFKVLEFFLVNSFFLSKSFYLTLLFSLRESSSLNFVVPKDANVGYDMTEVIEKVQQSQISFIFFPSLFLSFGKFLLFPPQNVPSQVVDHGEMFEIMPDFAKNIIVGFAVRFLWNSIFFQVEN